jgi:hypothetical protein
MNESVKMWKQINIERSVCVFESRQLNTYGMHDEVFVVTAFDPEFRHPLNLLLLLVISEESNIHERIRSSN